MPIPTMFEDAIAQQDGAYEPQRQYQWLLKIPGIKYGDVLELSLRSGVIPPESSEEIEIPMFNGRVYVAGKQTYDEGSFVFNDYVDKDTYGCIALWRDMVYDPVTKKQGYAKHYKKTGILALYSPDFEVERTFNLQGLWPKSLDGGSLDFSASETNQITVAFRFDRMIRKKGWKK